MTTEPTDPAPYTLDLSALLPFVLSPDRGAGTAALRGELRALQTQAADPGAPEPLRFQIHRQAAYLALDLNDVMLAMDHALRSLQCARASGDGPSQVKAHVTVALAVMEVYDDVGAQREFLAARTLAEQIGDHRGVALVAVNASHLELERRRYPEAARHLLDLLLSPSMQGLQESEIFELWETFHINFVIAVAETLLTGGELHPRDIGERQLGVSLRLVAALPTRGPDLPLLGAAAVLDALIRYALWTGDLTAARALADESVQITRDADFPLLYGRALLDRSRVHQQAGNLGEAIADAEQAVQYFREAASELWEVRSRELLAATYARAGRHREAFETQLAATHSVEHLYHNYHQQRALVDQVEQQAREAEVRARTSAEAALLDPLTGAPNRTRAMQVLGKLHARAGLGFSSSIALFDLDLFKRVNDTFGHLIGDDVLIQVTRLLSGELRGQDLLARLGGEEFIVILPELSLAQATQVCFRLRDALQQMDWEQLTPGLEVTGSFGVAVLSDQRDITGTLRAADQALYAAKAAGRNTVVAAPEAELD